MHAPNVPERATDGLSCGWKQNCAEPKAKLEERATHKLRKRSGETPPRDRIEHNVTGGAIWQKAADEYQAAEALRVGRFAACTKQRRKGRDRSW